MSRTLGQYLVEEFGFTVSRFYSQLDHEHPQMRVFNWHARGNPQDSKARVARYGEGADKAWGWPPNQLQHGVRRDFVFDVVPADVDLSADPWWAEDLKFVRGAWAKMQSLEPRGTPEPKPVPVPTPRPAPVPTPQVPVPPSLSSLDQRVEELRLPASLVLESVWPRAGVLFAPGGGSAWPHLKPFVVAALRLYRGLVAAFPEKK